MPRNRILRSRHRPPQSEASKTQDTLVISEDRRSLLSRLNERASALALHRAIYWGFPCFLE